MSTKLKLSFMQKGLVLRELIQRLQASFYPQTHLVAFLIEDSILADT